MMLQVKAMTSDTPDELPNPKPIEFPPLKPDTIPQPRPTETPPPIHDHTEKLPEEFPDHNIPKEV